MYYRCDACGYFTDNEDDFIASEYQELHTEIDGSFYETFNIYSCPNCGCDSYSDATIDDEDEQENFEDARWHTCYSCNGSCSECSRTCFEECTRSFKISQAEWLVGRAETIRKACENAMKIVSVLNRVSKNLEEPREKFLQRGTLSKMIAAVDYLSKREPQNTEALNLIRKYLHSSTFNSNNDIKIAVDVLLKMGALTGCEIDVEKYICEIAERAA